MKVVLFFSRFTFICNIAFLLFIIFRWIEVKNTLRAQGDVVFPVPFLKSVVITLGFSAIVINLAMNIVYLLLLLFPRSKKFSSWLVITNFLFLILQVYYFFFYKN
ncbi:MAG: hypothetical protein ABJA57_03845 [Ginsengibacter sp.]